VGRNITSWKFQASSEGTKLSDILTNSNTAFNAGDLNKVTFLGSYWSYGIISTVGSTEVSIGVLQWISTLTDIYLKKRYVDYIHR